MANYIEKININNSSIPIGGNNFDGQWVAKYLRILTDGSFTAGANWTQSLSSYLPNDGCQYELMIEAWGEKPAQSKGDTSSGPFMRVGNGTSNANAVVEHYLFTIPRNDTVTTRFGGGSTIIPISGSNRNIYFLNSGQIAINAVGINLLGYRRIGNNVPSGTNQISNISANSSTVTIGGNNFNGQWVRKWSTIYDATSMAAKATVALDLSSYLPNDNYNYEVLLDAYARSGEVNGNTVNISIGGITSDAVIASTETHSGNNNTKNNIGNLRMPVGTNRKLNVTNYGNAASGTTNIRLMAYRRIGTNT